MLDTLSAFCPTERLPTSSCAQRDRQKTSKRTVQVDNLTHWRTEVKFAATRLDGIYLHKNVHKTNTIKVSLEGRRHSFRNTFVVMMLLDHSFDAICGPLLPFILWQDQMTNLQVERGLRVFHFHKEIDQAGRKEIVILFKFAQNKFVEHCIVHWTHTSEDLDGTSSVKSMLLRWLLQFLLLTQSNLKATLLLDCKQNISWYFSRVMIS